MGNAMLGGAEPVSFDLERSQAEISAFNKKGLSEEILQQIFSYLSAAEVGRLGAVCKTWRRVSRSPDVWKQFCIETSADVDAAADGPQGVLPWDTDEDITWYVDWYAYYVKNFAQQSAIRWEPGKRTYTGQCLFTDMRAKRREGRVVCQQPSCAYRKNVERLRCLKCDSPLPTDSVSLQVPMQLTLTMFPEQSKFRLAYDTPHCTAVDKLPRCADSTFSLISYAMVAEGQYAETRGDALLHFDITGVSGYASGRRSKVSFRRTRRAAPRNWFHSVPQEVRDQLHFVGWRRADTAIDCSTLSFLLFAQSAENCWLLLHQNEEQILTEPLSVAEQWTACRLTEIKE